MEILKILDQGHCAILIGQYLLRTKKVAAFTAELPPLPAWEKGFVLYFSYFLYLWEVLCKTTTLKKELSWFLKIICVNQKFSKWLISTCLSSSQNLLDEKNHRKENLHLLVLYNFGYNIFFISAVFEKLLLKKTKFAPPHPEGANYARIFREVWKYWNIYSMVYLYRKFSLSANFNRVWTFFELKLQH